MAVLFLLVVIVGMVSLCRDVVSCGGSGQLAVPNMPLGGRSYVVVAVV